MTTSSGPGQERATRHWPAVILAILLLALLYLAQVTVARGYQGPRQAAELFTRSAMEWTAWAILLPAIVRLTDIFPIGLGRPRRNLAVQLAAGALVMPVWAALVAIPVSGLRIPLWGARPPAGFLESAESALLQRGPYLAIVYGLIVGLTTARRLAVERQAAATRTAELRRELAAADLAEFGRLTGSERLVEQLDEVERAMARSTEEAEAVTLALAEDLHGALIRSRDILKN